MSDHCEQATERREAAYAARLDAHATEIENVVLKHGSRLTFSDIKRRLTARDEWQSHDMFWQAMKRVTRIQDSWSYRLMYEPKEFYLKFEGKYEESKSTVRVAV